MCKRQFISNILPFVDNIGLGENLFIFSLLEAGLIFITAKCSSVIISYFLPLKCITGKSTSFIKRAEAKQSIIAA